MCVECSHIFKNIAINNLNKTLSNLKTHTTYDNGYEEGYRDGLNDIINLIEREKSICQPLQD